MKALYLLLLLAVSYMTQAQMIIRNEPKITETPVVEGLPDEVRYYAVYDARVSGLGWEMDITTYVLEKTKIPDNADFRTTFDVPPINGWYYGTMEVEGKQIKIVSKVSSTGSTGERPKVFDYIADRIR